MPAKKQSSNGKSFPHKLYALLDSAADKNFAHIISWQAGGKSFKVHQPKTFVKSILPVYFKQSKFKSFLRQLNIYGFQRIQYGPNKGGYTHQHLVQGVPELCLMIRRVSAPDGGKAAAAISVVPPNLSSTTRKRASMTPSTIHVVPSKDELISPSKGSLGSFDSLGSLGSLGMNGPENNFDLCGTQNEAFDMSCDGLSSFLGSSDSLGLSSKTTCSPGSGQQNEPFPLKDDFSAFGKPFLERNLSLMSNISFGGFSNSSSTSCHQGVRMNASELDLFKDLFKESDFEEDIPMHSPSHDKYNAMMSRHRSSTHGYHHHNSVFDHQTVSRSRGRSGTHLGPEYVTSNGFLEKKPGCLEPSMDELLSLVTENSERNEDLNRSEAVFPSKLHRMLQDAKREGFDHIVSWIHGGTAFKVHDIPLFMEKIMPIYFDQSKFESFRRQLNLYGFTRVTKGPSRGMYYHQDFVQNDPSLCQNITRPKSCRKRKSQSSTSNIRAGAVA